jgi:hypothetical protein
MKVTIKNKQIAESFRAVWDALPEEDWAQLAKRIGAVTSQDTKIPGSFTYSCNSGVVIYDSRANKANRPPYTVYISPTIEGLDIKLIKHYIAHELAHISREHMEDMSESSNGFLPMCETAEESEETAESEADELVNIWGYPNFEIEA